MYQLYDLIKTLGIRHLIKIRKVHNSMLKYARGYISSQCICALFNLGFFDRLYIEKKIDLDLYARENNLDKRILQVVCDYLYSLRILDRNNNSYTWGPEGKMLFELSRGVFDLLYAYAPLFQELEALLKKEKIYGQDVFRREKYVATGSAGITRYLPFPIVKDVIKKYGFKKILDLGCGSAEFLVSLCEDDKVTCYGIDISEDSINYAQEKVNEMGMKNKIILAVCDIFEIDKIAKMWGDVEVITCMFVLHEFLFEGRDRVINLLKKLKKNFENTYLIVCELCKRPSELLRKNCTAIAEHHLFHALSNQGLISSEEWEEIFNQAGYRLVEKRRFDFAEQGYFIMN